MQRFPKSRQQTIGSCILKYLFTNSVSNTDTQMFAQEINRVNFKQQPPSLHHAPGCAHIVPTTTVTYCFHLLVMLIPHVPSPSPPIPYIPPSAPPNSVSIHPYPSLQPLSLPLHFCHSLTSPFISTHHLSGFAPPQRPFSSFLSPAPSA